MATLEQRREAIRHASELVRNGPLAFRRAIDAKAVRRKENTVGYNIEHIQITVRLSAHNSEQDVKDKEAVENLKMEIRALVASDPDYERIVVCGC